MKKIDRMIHWSIKDRNLLFIIYHLSSLRAESARAVTGRRCPHSGKGEDFLTGQLNFFYGNCCNCGTESKKIIPNVGK